jgi:hypothetical protein
LRTHYLTLIAGVVLLAGSILWLVDRPAPAGDREDEDGRKVVVLRLDRADDARNVGDGRPSQTETGSAPFSTLEHDARERSPAPSPQFLPAVPAEDWTDRESSDSPRGARFEESLGSAPEGDRSISGRVVTASGEPVSAIDLTARRYYPEASDGSLVARGANLHRARSGPNGGYALRGLAAGAYEVRTLATDSYPSARTIVRAGSDSADVVVLANRAVRVRGTVTNEYGDPLARVRVIPADPNRKTWTDEHGTYETELIAKANGTYPFQFHSGEYEEKRIILRGRDVAGVGELQLDVQLETLGESVEIRGTLSTRDGERIAGENVHLNSVSLRTRYAASTDEDGNFSFPAVKVASDYRLMILPEGGYRDYEREALEVTRRTPRLDIVLEPLSTGRLSGRMLDVRGEPVSDFRLWLRSTEAQGRTIPVSSNDSGYFLVEDAPEGPLMLVTRSQPHMQIAGITLFPGMEKDVDLVLDWGDAALEGRVLDDRGSPIGGARVSLSWSHDRGAAHSSSLRETVTDEAGVFRFTQLGPGDHEVRIRAIGYHEERQRIPVERQTQHTELRLERTPG